MFFCAWLLAILAVALAFAGDKRTRQALVLGFGASVLAYNHNWGTLYAASLGVDPASLVFTLTGSVLLLWARDPAGAHAAACRVPLPGDRCRREGSPAASPVR